MFLFITLEEQIVQLWCLQWMSEWMWYSKNLLNLKFKGLSSIFFNFKYPVPSNSASEAAVISKCARIEWTKVSTISAPSTSWLDCIMWETATELLWSASQNINICSGHLWNEAVEGKIILHILKTKDSSWVTGPDSGLRFDGTWTLGLFILKAYNLFCWLSNYSNFEISVFWMM